MSSESSRRKRVVLTMRQKLDVIERVDKGESIKVITDEFGIGYSTVKDWLRKKNVFKNYCAQFESENILSKRRTFRRPTSELLDEALWEWYLEECEKGAPITKAVLKEQANLILNAIGSVCECPVSDVWLRRWRKRYVPQQQPSLSGSGGPSSPVSIPNPPKKSIASRPTPTQSPQPQPAVLPPMQANEEVPGEVCLRWNSYHKNMQTFFPSLLNNEQFVDVTLACEGQSIKCHKVMLSACSTYFEDLLSQNPCQHPIVLMKDMCFWEIQALVDFMYRGEVNVSQDKLPQLLKAAETLKIKGLASPTPGGSSNTNDEDSRCSSNNSDGTGGFNRRQRKRKMTKYPKSQMNHQRPTTPFSSLPGNLSHRFTPNAVPSMARTPISGSGSTSPLSTQPANTNSPLMAAESGLMNCTNVMSANNSPSDTPSGQYARRRKSPNPSHHAVALTTEKISEQPSPKIFIKEEPDEIMSESKMICTPVSRGGDSEEENDSICKEQQSYEAKDMRYTFDEEEDGSDSTGSGNPMSPPPPKVIVLQRSPNHHDEHNNEDDHEDEEIDNDEEEYEDEGDGNF